MDLREEARGWAGNEILTRSSDAATMVGTRKNTMVATYANVLAAAKNESGGSSLQRTGDGAIALLRRFLLPLSRKKEIKIALTDVASLREQFL